MLDTAEEWSPSSPVPFFPEDYYSSGTAEEKENHNKNNNLAEKHKLACPSYYQPKKAKKMKFRQLFGLSPNTTNQSKNSSTMGQQNKPDPVITQTEFSRLYTTGAMLGKGGFGTVYSGFRNSDHLPVAIKMIAKNRIVHLSNSSSERLPLEVALMRLVSHIDGVIKFIDYFELPDCFLLIMERMMSTVSANSDIKTTSTSCKDLFDFISDNGPIKEDLARWIFQQVLHTVLQVRQAGVIHRDIKDENILIDTKTNKVKLIDFGSGAKWKDEVYTDFDGTRVYAPPEWIKFRRYRGDGLTTWSLGILLYDMLCGDIPFESDSQIKRAHVPIRDSLRLSPEVTSLIHSCLTISTSDRVTLDQLACHPWVTKVSTFGSLHPILNRSISAPVDVIPASKALDMGATSAMSMSPPSIISSPPEDDEEYEEAYKNRDSSYYVTPMSVSPTPPSSLAFSPLLDIKDRRLLNVITDQPSSSLNSSGDSFYQSSAASSSSSSAVSITSKTLQLPSFEQLTRAS